MSNVNGSNPTDRKGIVKKVLSGDTIIIRGAPKGGPPPELYVSLAFIAAPKIGRKFAAKEVGDDTKIVNDEPYAWESREFMRKLLVGKEVTFRKLYDVPALKRDCGLILLNDENVGEKLVSEGLAKVIRRKQNEDNEYYKLLIQLEENATKPKPEPIKRVVKYDVDDPSELEKRKFHGIVEDVIDGSTMRIGVFLDSVYQYITIMLAGIKCPQIDDRIGQEAKYFTECRLLNKDVDVYVQHAASETQRNKFYGSVLIDEKNIAEFLVKEGMARLMNNSLSVSQNATALRNAEKEAKQKKLRLFKDFTEAKSPESDTVEVVEVINADALKVKKSNNEVRKIFLSSIRPPPKPEGLNEKSKPLYDVPLMFEAREYLRKRLIGKRVQVTTDYVQPAKSSDFGKPELAEKECCTVMLGNVNMAEALVAKGYATVVKHRDSEKRSSQYDLLLDAEMKAQKSKKGIHAATPPGPTRIVDLSGDVQKAKHHFNFLQRGSANARLPASVEYVYSSSRVKLYVPKENCVLNFILAGINAPKAQEKYGNEGLNFLRSLIHQRDVEISVDSMDKLGNFIGVLLLDNKNISLELVANGYASVRDGKGGNQLISAEEEAKRKKLNIWKDYVESEKKTDENESENVNDSPKDDKRVEVMVMNVSPQMTSIYVQKVENETRLEELLNELRDELSSNPPLPGSYQIKKNEIYAAKYSVDDQWYRAKVEKSRGTINEVLFIDYGNREEVALKDLAPLPSSKYAVSDLSAKEYGLAFVTLPETDLDAIEEAKNAFSKDTCNKKLRLKVEYKDVNTGFECVTLLDDKKDVVLSLVADGYFAANVKSRRERRHEKTFAAYREAHETAKRKRLNIWRYGDFTEDDAIEFGLGK